MQCECQLPCRPEPVNESDGFGVLTLLFLTPAVVFFFVHDGHRIEIWLPLLGAALLFSMISRHYHQKRRSSQPLVRVTMPEMQRHA
jgi:hypothetical protein